MHPTFAEAHASSAAAVLALGDKPEREKAVVAAVTSLACPECWMECASASALHKHYEEDHLPWALRITRGPPSQTEANVARGANGLYDAIYVEKDVPEARQKRKGLRCRVSFLVGVTCLLCWRHLPG